VVLVLGERWGEQANLGRFDETTYTVQILFSSQVCSFISSRDRDNFDLKITKLTLIRKRQMDGVGPCVPFCFPLAFLSMLISFTKNLQD
jgi:hypothetical protein